MYLGRILYTWTGGLGVLLVRIVVGECPRVNGENMSPVIRSFSCCSLNSWKVVVEEVNWLSGLLFAVVVHLVSVSGHHGW